MINNIYSFPLLLSSFLMSFHQFVWHCSLHGFVTTYCILTEVKVGTSLYMFFYFSLDILSLLRPRWNNSPSIIAYTCYNFETVWNLWLLFYQQFFYKEKSKLYKKEIQNKIILMIKTRKNEVYFSIWFANNFKNMSIE